VQCSAGKMNEARQGRCAKQDRADARGKAGRMFEARQGGCSSEGGCGRQGRQDARGN
jgi:hypothetical protein